LKNTEPRALCSVLLTEYHLGDQIKKNEMGRACNTYGKEVPTEFWWGNLREENHFKDLGVDGLD
jgi:hypothetical protein